MQLKRAGSQPSQTGPAEYFTGMVRIDPLNAPPAPARVSCASITFEPGARSAWHTHPLGQTLIVTAGCGWTQCEGEPIVEIRAGDVFANSRAARCTVRGSVPRGIERMMLKASRRALVVAISEPP